MKVQIKEKETVENENNRKKEYSKYKILVGEKEIGFCEFYNFDSIYPNSVEARYTLWEAYQNKGLGAFIWMQIREIYEKMHPEMQRIYCLVSPNNIKSIKIVRKDMQLDYKFYEIIQKEGTRLYYPYYACNPYYKKNRKEIQKELTYKVMSAKI